MENAFTADDARSLVLLRESILSPTASSSSNLLVDLASSPCFLSSSMPSILEFTASSYSAFRAS